VAVSQSRTERLINLVICLLSTRRYLTAAQIAATVPGYEHDPNDPRAREAFQRKFERDKAELRELGVPLETGTNSVFDHEPGYRIARRAYALPEIVLAPEEAAAVGIAARLWRHARLSAAATRGLAKLRAAGVEVDPQATLGVEPVVSVDAAFTPLVTAARERRTVTFDYRTPQRDEPATRRLHPWGVVCWRGRWYVVGHDLDRGAARCFRLSRIVGPVRVTGDPGAFPAPPSTAELLEYVARWPGSAEPTRAATVLVRPGRAAGLRRRADQVVPTADGDRLRVPFTDLELLAAMLAGYGADVRVLDPPELRDAVIYRLKETATRHQPVEHEAVADGLLAASVHLPADRAAEPVDHPAAPAPAEAPAASPPDPHGARGAADRLVRLLSLVPYLLNNPGVELAQVAQAFDTSERQIRADLNLLWMCGLPGYGPGDLIDMAFDGDRVTITYDAGIDQPLRLTADEALALVVALRLLAEMPGLANRDAVAQALAKIENAAGEVAHTPVAVRMPAPDTRVERLRAAVHAGRALRITYYTASRDETTERVVDPLRVLLVDGRTYLEAWCRRAEAVRLFRVDRIDALTELDEPARPPAQARPQDVSVGVFRPGPELPRVTLAINKGGRWITEYYPCEEVRRGPGETWTVTMRVADLGWARRFALGLGPEVTVLSPSELVEAIQGEAVAALEAYAVPGPAGVDG